ncbi:major facilitator superfamily [Heterobasidion irregulare TC 32-1]|uniref:Major facilitator superfamily n=1 Tax=Heterobasidion irregulare (strain TC 32-1) TaxID=747525 RepID=W4KMU6_HETIT|nr:major facilitator superfamily [Heterobasidion irregulare TC 32-1]ETW87168.1 major facilitator superfamily [Heterobasidion irregulare TC 32-1]
MNQLSAQTVNQVSEVDESVPEKAGSLKTNDAVSIRGVAEVPRDEELRLLRKFDWLLLPPLTFMYLCNALDKGNVGNAKTDGWDKDTHLTGDQYYLLVMIFYVPFCLFGTPISIFIKRFSAARVLPIMMIGFVCNLSPILLHNFSQIFAIRFFLGIFESAMLPGVVFYLSTFYKRNELASRVGLFYGTIVRLPSGLLAFGVFHIHDPKYHSWQFLFWVEGGATVIFAVFALLWLPRSPTTWWFLTEREKEIAAIRILSDSSTAVNEKLNIRDAFRPFKDWHYWIWAFISLALGVPLASVNNFLPQIVASLGYSTVKTNLYTIAPNIVGTVALLVLTFSSDHFRERSIHICIPLATALTGFIILGCIDPTERKAVAYFACFLLTMGAFAPSVLVASWYANNTPSENRRAVVAAVMVAIANAAGLISTNVFRAKDEPKYVPALITSAVFGAFCLVLVASMGVYMRWENRRKNREQGVSITAADVSTQALGEGHQSPSFRWMY